MKVLLIWDQCGMSDPELYLVTGVNAELVIKCHNQYINDSGLADDAPIHLLNEIAWDEDNGFERVEPSEPLTCDRLVICGFIP